MRKLMSVPALVVTTVGFAMTGCAGGAEEAALMPSPILCSTIMDLSPAYVRYGEYLAELRRRGEDCSSYVGDARTVRLR